MEWIFKRCELETGICKETPIGYVPLPESLDLSGLKISSKNIEELLSVDPEFFREEVEDIRKYFDEYVNDSMPKEIYNQLDELELRIIEKIKKSSIMM